MTWRRDLLLGTAASFVAALPGLVGQVAAGRALGKAQDLASLLALGSSSRWHLALQPLDALMGGALRLLFLAACVHLLAWVLVGRTRYLETLAGLGRAARLLFVAPLLAALIVGVGWLAASGRMGAPVAGVRVAYLGSLAWVGAQALLWLGVLLRWSGELARRHGLRRAEALLLGTAPAWALVLVGLLG